LPFLESGEAKALVSMTLKRPQALPNTPTIAEAGYPKFNLISWMGVFARAGTQNDKIRFLSDEIIQAVEGEDIRQRLLQLGLEPSPLANDKFGSFIEQDIQNWAEMTRATLN
jgi:tripartite-type tricarboxylate transporter receptor subunit TctC